MLFACVGHLVGLVDVVTIQGAEQMLQTGHVVVVYGMDDGLHHKGVFLILRVGKIVTLLLFTE